MRALAALIMALSCVHPTLCECTFASRLAGKCDDDVWQAPNAAAAPTDPRVGSACATSQQCQAEGWQPDVEPAPATSFSAFLHKEGSYEHPSTPLPPARTDQQAPTANYVRQRRTIGTNTAEQLPPPARAPFAASLEDETEFYRQTRPTLAMPEQAAEAQAGSEALVASALSPLPPRVLGAVVVMVALGYIITLSMRAVLSPGLAVPLCEPDAASSVASVPTERQILERVEAALRTRLAAIEAQASPHGFNAQFEHVNIDAEAAVQAARR